ncbi:MAG: M48 family metalloprotease [Hyphomonadaceae bacterium]
MRRAFKAATAGLLGAALAACASVAPQVALPASDAEALRIETERQQDDALAAEQSRYERLNRIWWRLITTNEALCADRGRAAGFTLHSLNSYPRELREAATRRFGVDADAAVDYVAPGSAAAAAGIAPGDEIVSINGLSVRAGVLNERRNADDRAVEDASEKLGDAIDADAPVTLLLRRGEEARTITYTPDAACDYDLLIARDDSVNAAANGRAVLVTTGLLRYLQSDTELAVVVGHELGHNALSHRDRAQDATRGGRWGGAALGILLGAATGVYIDFGAMAARGTADMRRTFEQEADYVGMYFAARAGYDIAGVEQFWRRFATDYPTSTYLRDTHPTTAERFLNIGLVIREIAEKQEAGAPLTPNSAEPAQTAARH